MFSNRDHLHLLHVFSDAKRLYGIGLFGLNDPWPTHMFLNVSCWGAGPLAAQSAIGAKKPGGLGEGEHGHPETVPITPWVCRDHAKTGGSRGG